MMKKLTLKSLHVGSPRRDHGDHHPEENGGAGTSTPPHHCVHANTGCPAHTHSRSTPGSSQEDSRVSCCDSYTDRNADQNCAATPKRKEKNGFFNTIRRKFTPSKKKEENFDISPSHGSRASRWHEEGQRTMPLPRRHRQRSSHSAERAVTPRSSHNIHYPGSLTRPRKSHHLSLHSSSSSSQHRGPREAGQEKATSPPPAQDCRPQESPPAAAAAAATAATAAAAAAASCVKQKAAALNAAKSLFPFDTEYGHTSAPFNGDDNDNNIPHGFQGTPIRGSSPPHCSSLAMGAVGGSHESGQTSPGCQLVFACGDPSPLLTADEQFEYSSSSGESQHSIAGIVCRLPPNVYDQVKDPPKESWSLSKELFKLSKFGWYWGPITRREAEDKLMGHPDGAFLVRDSSDERYLLSLSFCSYGRTLHTRIEHSNGVFSFYAQPEGEGYSSIVDLIEHSMNDSQTGVFCYSRARTPGSPSFPVRLTKPVSRFTQVRTLQYLCRFVIRQYTRFDHIQTLPLPTSIKGWLLENQY